MANNLKGNPWVLDTADSNTIVHPGLAFVEAIEWSGYSNAAHTCVLTDGKRNVDIVNWLGDTALNSRTTNFGSRVTVRDLIVKTLGSGQVRIWLK